MGLWHPVSLSPSCVTRGGERQVVGSLVGTVWPMGHQVKAWRSSCLLAPLGSWGDVVYVCVCVCESSTAEEELGWDLGFGRLPPVYSAHCLQGWEWCLGRGTGHPNPL